MRTHQANKKTAVKLFVIWCVSCLALSAISSYRRIYHAILGTEQTIISKPDWFLILMILLTSCYIMPLLLNVYRHAKNEQIKWLIGTAKVLLLLFIVALIVIICAVFLS